MTASSRARSTTCSPATACVSSKRRCRRPSPPATAALPGPRRVHRRQTTTALAAARDLARAQAAARTAVKTIPFQADYARRAGVEGTMYQAASHGARRARYRGPKPGSTTCTWPARSTSSGWRHSGPARHETGSEPATWHDSNSASPHRTRINHQDPTAVPAAGRHPLALELAAQLRVLSLPTLRRLRRSPR